MWKTFWEVLLIWTAISFILGPIVGTMMKWADGGDTFDTVPDSDNQKSWDGDKPRTA